MNTFWPSLLWIVGLCGFGILVTHIVDRIRNGD